MKGFEGRGQKAFFTGSDLLHLPTTPKNESESESDHLLKLNNIPGRGLSQQALSFLRGDFYQGLFLVVDSVAPLVENV